MRPLPRVWTATAVFRQGGVETGRVSVQARALSEAVARAELMVEAYKRRPPGSENAAPHLIDVRQESGG